MSQGVRTAIQLDTEATQELLDWAAAIAQSDETYFHKAQLLATHLGAQPRPNGLVYVGLWAPELAPGTVQPKDIFLEVFTPIETVEFTAPIQTVRFRRDRLQLQQQGEYFWGAVTGLQVGTREQLGSLYWLRYLNEHPDPLDTSNPLKIINDVLAYSLPYGVFAPAEVYDMERLQLQRADLGYFERGNCNPDGVIQVQPPVNILQMHVNTASQEGSLEGLTRVYRRIATKLVAGEPLTPAEQNYVGYDAIQLLPVEPTIEYRGEGALFWEQENDDFEAPEVTVTLRKPNTQNWGYDIVIASSSATNPSVLGTLRPDEVVEFIETLHTFPTGPIQLIYDVVYGHADNQAQDLLNGRFLKGPNMYGQDVNHQNPTVRAILLEMQRRKVNTGADGIRVDGAQDFKYFNPLSGRVEYDDAYLQEMFTVKQEIAGRERQLFSIFEDGRPWPEDGWETKSTYLEVIQLIPECYQWGPLIFAHNTPALEGFWDAKWDRICEVMHHGGNWITGCANHDTVRRGTQIAPDGAINWNLGNTLPEVLDNAYDNPATTLFTYGFCPGLPMDFINATMHAAWGFIRNTDDYYGVKVVAEEGGFLDWQIDPNLYAEAGVFERLKHFGFTNYDELKDFIHGLHDAIVQVGYDLDEVARICQGCLADDVDTANWEELVTSGEILSCPIAGYKLSRLNRQGKSKALSRLDVDRLKLFARAFMEDCHDICHVPRYADALDPARTAYNLRVREFRHEYTWLRRNLVGSDRFNRVSGKNHTVLYGLRTEPADLVPTSGEAARAPQQVAIVAHMGGEPATVTLGDWLQIDLDAWDIAIASPGLELEAGLDNLRTFELRDSQAVLFLPKVKAGASPEADGLTDPKSRFHSLR